MHCVEDEGIDVVAPLVEGEEGLFEVAAAVALQEADDVFEQDERGSARAELVEQANQSSERRRFLAA